MADLRRRKAGDGAAGEGELLTASPNDAGAQQPSDSATADSSDHVRFTHIWLCFYLQFILNLYRWLSYANVWELIVADNLRLVAS